jgi:hypothetical protein
MKRTVNRCTGTGVRQQGMTGEDIESQGVRDFRRASQWCLVAWSCILIGICGTASSHIIIEVGGGILLAAGFLFVAISAVVAFLGLLSPGGVRRIRFAGVLLLSVLPILGLSYVLDVNFPRRHRCGIRIDPTRTAIASAHAALAVYHLDCGSYPTTEQGLKAFLNNPGVTGWNGPYVLPAKESQEQGRQHRLRRWLRHVVQGGGLHERAETRTTERIHTGGVDGESVREMKLNRAWVWSGVAVLGLLVSAGVLLPSFIKARSTSCMNACINNLRQIQAAKEGEALAHGWTNGTPCDTADARAAVNQYIKNGGVSCPQGGQYTYNSVGVVPVCSLGQANASTIRYRLFKTTETGQHSL